MGGAHLNSVAPSAISSAANVKIVRARFDADLESLDSPVAAAGARRTRRVHDVNARLRIHGASRMKQGDGFVFGFMRARCEPRARSASASALRKLCHRSLDGSGSSACASSGAPIAASSGNAARRSFFRSDANSQPLGTRKHLNPKTPASQSGLSSRDISRHYATPEADVDRKLACRCGQFLAKGASGGGCRNAVERHLDRSS